MFYTSCIINSSSFCWIKFRFCIIFFKPTINTFYITYVEYSSTKGIVIFWYCSIFNKISFYVFYASFIINSSTIHKTKFRIYIIIYKFRICNFSNISLIYIIYIFLIISNSSSHRISSFTIYTIIFKYNIFNFFNCIHIIYRRTSCKIILFARSIFITCSYTFISSKSWVRNFFNNPKIIIINSSSLQACPSIRGSLWNIVFK